MTLADLVNDLPDLYRIAILPVIRILAVVYGWQMFEDGSIIP